MKRMARGAGARAVAGLLIILSMAIAAPASQDGRSHVRTVEEFEFAPGRPGMTVATYVPKTSSRRKPRPLILALHYGGPVTPTTGRDFAEMLILPAMKDLGAVILVPNCPGRGWTDPISEDAVLKLVAAARKKYAIDERRVAVTGFSMGAIGAYRLAARHPELFTAAIPVSGMPSSGDLESLRDMPLFVIHSDGDEVFPMDEAGPAFETLRRDHPDVTIEIVPGLSHYRTADFVPALKKAALWLRKVWRNP
jgi:poly(3-hydroxybutyrate) depolymerase